MKVQAHNIRVATVFEPGGKIRPVWFDWQRRKHTIIETTYTWEGRKGTNRLLHFSVRDDGGIFELTYDTVEQTWCLEGLEATP
ncbi:MAG TPA: hypothetical protein VIU41_14845 [Geobacteraceae bacterium]